MSRSFQHLRPCSAQEACELKAKYGPTARFWAGGTDLLLEWRRGAIELDYCIDLSALRDLRTIQFQEGGVRIGALVTIASIHAERGFDRDFAVLRAAASQFATPQIRNTATLGGNLCHAVPSADFAPPLIALDAELTLLGLDGERSMPLEAFFQGVKRTALRPDEMLLEIRIPKPPPRAACAFERVTRSSVDIALVNAAVRITIDPAGAIQEARVVLGAVAPVPLRAKRAEGVLMGNSVSELGQELQAQVGRLAAAETHPITDVRTTAAYRRYVSEILVRRALHRALRRLGEK
jgi:carbon-monoxide dehydrogenase medium subunit